MKRDDPMRIEPPMQAEFVHRPTCIACESADLRTVAEGKFSDEPLRSFIDQDPWGENPLPSLAERGWRIVACRACSQLFHAQILSPEWNEIRFERWMTAAAIATFEALHPRNDLDFWHRVHLARLSRLTAAIRGKAAMRLLDFGCGSGGFIAAALERGADAYGVDRSAARRAAAGDRVVPELSMLEGTFHAATLFEVLEHLDAPLDVLRALPVCAGGILVLETPNCHPAVHGISTLRDYQLAHPLEHINLFTPHSLQAIAERAGYKRILPPLAGAPLRTLKRNFLAATGRDSTQQYFVKTHA